MPRRQEKDNYWVQNLNVAGSQRIWLHFQQKVIVFPTKIYSLGSLYTVLYSRRKGRKEGRKREFGEFKEKKEIDKRNCKVLCTETRKMEIKLKHFVFTAIKLVIP